MQKAWRWRGKKRAGWACLGAVQSSAFELESLMQGGGGGGGPFESRACINGLENGPQVLKALSEIP